MSAREKVSAAVNKRVGAKRLCDWAWALLAKGLEAFYSLPWVGNLPDGGCQEEKLDDTSRPLSMITLARGSPRLPMSSPSSFLCGPTKRYSGRLSSGILYECQRRFRCVSVGASASQALAFYVVLLIWYVGVGGKMSSPTGLWCINCHIFAGFGMAGLPGVWTILFTHCLMGVARSEEVVDLPMVVHVDDVAIIAELQAIVDAQSGALADFLLLFMRSLRHVPGIIIGRE